MIETFRETPEQMGMEPTGADPVTGEFVSIRVNSW